jgi:hypothetical protein
MYGDRANTFAVEKLQTAVRNPAQRMRFLQDGVEHRHKVAGRRIDDLENFSRRCLLRASFVALRRALGELSLQPGDV